MKSPVSCKCGKVSGTAAVIVKQGKLKQVETALVWELSEQFYNHPKEGLMCLSCNYGVFSKGDWE